MKRLMLLIVSLAVFATLALSQSPKPKPPVMAKVQVRPTATSGIFPGTQHQVVLTWTASTTTGATSNVWRGTASGQESKLTGAQGLTSPTFTDTTVINGSSYFYYVTAQLGVNESGGSNEIGPLVIPTNPAPPTGLTGTAQ